MRLTEEQIQKRMKEWSTDEEYPGKLNEYLGWTEEDFERYIILRVVPEQETVICSAIKLPDGRIIRGHRHGDCMRTARELINHRHSIGLEEGDFDQVELRFGPDSQGFITSQNRYVGREEAFRIQHAACIPSACKSGYRRKDLFSEDLY